jgi:hypothetical protein
MKNDAVCRQAGRMIHDLMGRLAAARMARQPGADEADVRRDLWRQLREHAQLDDPNCPDATSSFLAVWVLTALWEMEKDRDRGA